MSNVGENIKKIRKEKKKTQEEMANLLGISRSYLANLEAGRKNVGENTIKKMSESSGLSTYYLTTGEKAFEDMTNRDYSYHLDDFHILLDENKEEKFDNMLTELTKVKLSLYQTILLKQIVSFLKESTSDEADELAEIITMINHNRFAFTNPKNLQDYSKEEILEMIDDNAEYFKKFLKSYYKVNEKSD